MLEHSQHCDLVAGQITSTMPIIMPAPLSAWNLYGDPRLVTIRRVNIPNSSFSKCDMCPYFGGVEESQVNQDSLFEGGRPHIGRPHWLQDFRESCIKCDCWVRDQRGSLLESHQAHTHHHLSGGYHCRLSADTHTRIGGRWMLTGATKLSGVALCSTTWATAHLDTIS